MKISLVSSTIYQKKYPIINRYFSDSFCNNPLSFGNDSFQKTENPFDKTNRLRERYERIKKQNEGKVYDSSLESQEELFRDNEKILREYKEIKKILNASGKLEYSKDANIILNFLDAMDNMEKDRGFNRISGYEEIKEKLKGEFILSSIMKDRTSQGADVPNAVLFFGPSNTGKTTFAQALAEQSLSNIETVSGGEDDAMEAIKGYAEESLKNYNKSLDKKRTIIVLNEAELLTNKYSLDLEEFKDFIKDCSSKYKCTLFLTTNMPLQIDKEILAQINFKVPVAPADIKTCKEIICDYFKLVDINPRGNVDNLTKAFFVNPEKVYSNGDIVKILTNTLNENQNATISDFIKTIKIYETSTISNEDMKDFEEAKKELVE